MSKEQQFTINDLNILIKAVDIAASRGAFRANEMAEVGAAFNNLTSFMTQAQQQVAQAPGQVQQPQQPPAGNAPVDNTTTSTATQ